VKVCIKCIVHSAVKFSELVKHVRCQASFSLGAVTDEPAGCLLWCQCVAELHVLSDEYTGQLTLTDKIT